MADQSSTDILALTAQIVSAHVAKNEVAASELPALIHDVHRALASVGRENTPATADRPQPAVPVKKSVYPEYIICLEDGKKFKS